jgi:hypothetical protein
MIAPQLTIIISSRRFDDMTELAKKTRADLRVQWIRRSL